MIGLGSDKNDLSTLVPLNTLRMRFHNVFMNLKKLHFGYGELP